MPGKSMMDERVLQLKKFWIDAEKMKLLLL